LIRIQQAIDFCVTDEAKRRILDGEQKIDDGLIDCHPRLKISQETGDAYRLTLIFVDRDGVEVFTSSEITLRDGWTVDLGDFVARIAIDVDFTP
jgi:hypothetical protein